MSIFILMGVASTTGAIIDGLQSVMHKAQNRSRQRARRDLSRRRQYR